MLLDGWWHFTRGQEAPQLIDKTILECIANQIDFHEAGLPRGLVQFLVPRAVVQVALKAVMTRSLKEFPQWPSHSTLRKVPRFS